MAKLLAVHPRNPQPRLLKQAADVLSQGGVIAYPTDSAYALGCQLGNKEALERIRRIRGVSETHYMTLVCRDLSELATYATVDNGSFRLLKSHTPGAYTFLLPATKAVPRYFQRKTRAVIGLRVPDHQVTQTLLTEYNEPIASTTLILPNKSEPLYDPERIAEVLANDIDLVIDAGYCSIQYTTILDLCQSPPKLIRRGKGQIDDELFTEA